MPHTDSSRTDSSRTDSSRTRPVPVRDNSARGQRRTNLIARTLLTSPLHGLMSRKVTLLYVTGRKTGARYAVPSAYAEHDGQVLLASAGTWTRNLAGRARVELLHRGRRLTATAEIAADRDRAYQIALALLPPNPILRNFIKVGLDADRRPDRDEFDAARERGVKFIALHPEA